MSFQSERRRSEQLEALIESGTSAASATVDRDVAAVAALALELRQHAAAPPSQRHAALRAHALARQTARGHRRAVAISGLAAVLFVLSAGVALAAIPAAAPIRDALQSAVEDIFESRPTEPMAPAAPTDAPLDETPTSTAAGAAEPTATAGQADEQVGPAGPEVPPSPAATPRASAPAAFPAASPATSPPTPPTPQPPTPPSPQPPSPPAPSVPQPPMQPPTPQPSPPPQPPGDSPRP